MLGSRYDLLRTHSSMRGSARPPASHTVHQSEPAGGQYALDPGGQFIQNLSSYLGRGFELSIKFEGLDPTGSFKHRGMTAEVSEVLGTAPRPLFAPRPATLLPQPLPALPGWD